jgi:hypothetical protein
MRLVKDKGGPEDILSFKETAITPAVSGMDILDFEEPE